MLFNYFKITLRNLLRHKGYSFINIAGLAAGIACCVLIMLYVQDELSYDKFHENADNIYRVSPILQSSDIDLKAATTSVVYGPLMKSTYPEVINYTRFSDYGSRRFIKYEEKVFMEERFIWVDSTVFNVFSFGMIKGNPNTALTAPNTVVLTEDMADKYFGDEDPLGKVLNVHGTTDYTVTGVVENVPGNSQLRPDFFASFSTLEEEPVGNTGEAMLSQMNYLTYIQLQDGYNFKNLEAQFPVLVDKYLGQVLQGLGATLEINLQPLTSIHLHSDLDFDFVDTGNIAYVYLFSGIALFILLLACINFTNLSTARSANRAKEVGLRKVSGAYRSQLIWQFIGESFILTFIALILAVILVHLFMPAFIDISGKELVIDYVNNPLLPGSLAGLFLIVSLAAGSYPAFFLSAFRPVDVLKGTLKSGTKSSILRSVLVVFQFGVSIVLIIGTLIIYNQLDYIKNKSLGYDKDHLVVIRLRGEEILNKIDVIQQELENHSNIISTCASQQIPGVSINSTAFHPAGKPEEDLFLFNTLTIDNDFISTYKMELLKGRDFSEDFSTDINKSIIINESAARELGWYDDPIGKDLEMYTGLETRISGMVIGMVKDFHFESLHKEIRPLILNAYTEFGRLGNITVRVKPENITGTIDFLKAKWREFEPDRPFEYYFLDERFDSQYRAEERMGSLFRYFTTLAILIGCLGLIGLASFTAEQRTKEIGIRKTFGATVLSIVMLLSKEFTKWVIFASFAAWPVAYFIMDDWLQNFAYRIEMPIGSFVLAGIIALAIALLTVSYQAVKAAFINPVNALRHE